MHTSQPKNQNMEVAIYSLLTLLIICLFQILPSNSTNTIIIPPNNKQAIITSGKGPIIPDLTKCGPTNLPPGAKETNCCPPPRHYAKIIDFKLPPDNADVAPLRVRRPAHLADEEYIRKLSRAFQLMRELPDDDPRSLKQQANVHCAYCKGSYHQVGFPDKVIQVHKSWLFFPFHRLYLYFFERICAKLIDDPNFALPFWNWDSPDSMTAPPMYGRDTQSPLYDKYRDPKHLTPHLADMDYNFTDRNMGQVDRQVSINLSIMYRQMVSGASTPELFMGSPYRAGDDQRPGGGTIELVPHNTLHSWVGDRGQINIEDMGDFYSAARDPIFFSHHSNIDRMWSIWKTLEGQNRHDFTDPAWLDAEFFFYDENVELVRIKVRDSLNMTKLGYVYQEVDNTPWLNYKHEPSTHRKFKSKKFDHVNDVVFPFRLDKVVSVVVPRRRKRDDEVNREEILVIEGINVERDVFVKFDVLINVEKNEAAEVGPDQIEFAGSFVNLPHEHRKKTQMRLGISDILEKLGAKGDNVVLITLVPRSEFIPVMIAGVKIEMDKDQEQLHTSA